MKISSLLFFTFCVFHLNNALKSKSRSLQVKKKAKWALIRSSGGCLLNGRPEVKAFIFQDMKHYENVLYEQVKGARNEIYFFDEDDKESEHFYLDLYSRKKCNQLLVDRGFKRSEEKRKSIQPKLQNKLNNLNKFKEEL